MFCNLYFFGSFYTYLTHGKPIDHFLGIAGVFSSCIEVIFPGSSTCLYTPVQSSQCERNRNGEIGSISSIAIDFIANISGKVRKPVHSQYPEIVAYLSLKCMAGIVHSIMKISRFATDPVVRHRNTEALRLVS